jgi:hypothetical protein
VTTTPDHPLGRAVLPAAYRAAGRDPARIAADPQHVRNALAWRHQVGRAHRFLADEVPAARVLRLRLEEFSLSPRATAERLADFLGLARPRVAELVRVDEARLGPRARGAEATEVLAIARDVAAQVGYADGWLDAPWEAPERRALFA